MWMRIAGQPLFGSAGEFIGYRGTGHNITPEMETMRRLEETNAALAERNNELDEARAALERAAYKDTLTGLMNRRAFERDFAAVFGKRSTQIALLHLDLDRFKWVNDTLGHQAGDAVLVDVADRISEVVGDKGTVYRVGGDEFLIILSNCVTADLSKWVADTLVEVVSEPFAHKQQRATVGASVGIALRETNDLSPGRLVANADAALYKAKRSGRNRTYQITPDMQRQMQAHRRLAADIPGGLERGEFFPFFQPQIHVGTGEVVGAEALVRWQHPQRGILQPGVFLNAAAERGMVSEIDRSMLQQALAAAGRLTNRGLNLPSISVNISAARLMDPNLLNDIERCWVDRRCKLSVELLETIYFDEGHENPQFTENLDKLREMGVRIETDDFGSGRASITGLLKVRPDRLKIDRGLIQAAVNDPVKRSVVATILDMTRTLGIEAMAEGVETQADIDAIRALGCNIFQGYALSYPLSEEDLAVFLAARCGSNANRNRPKPAASSSA
jgi:diguanylate cyclase (GGDEF)-like protein